MSPEQAEGRTVDARSDIFAFGAVLYEMLTGRRAFEGPSKMATLSSVIREEPKPIAEVAPSVPREVEKLVARCLRKDVERRAQHMSDVKLALDEIKEDSESGRLAAGPPSSSHPPSRERRAWIAACLMLVCAIGIWLWKGRNSNQTPPTLVSAAAYGRRWPHDNACDLQRWKASRLRVRQGDAEQPRYLDSPSDKRCSAVPFDQA
jgi:serine/threonine protein kinase